MIRQLEAKLKQKQRDLEEIERRRPQHDLDTATPQPRDQQNTWRDPPPDTHSSHRKQPAAHPVSMPTNPRKVCV